MPNDSLLLYLPMDRRQALAQGRSLPDRAYGSALFADISGFTALTAALLHELGAQRGPEELTAILNRVYTAVIDEVHDHGGSVIAFAGDAITCWFDERNASDDAASAPRRATASALAIQRTMAQFAAVQTPGGRSIALAVSVGVASGPARRFLVGNPAIRIIDALAGRTLERLAQTEHAAQQGQVVVDRATLDALGGAAATDALHSAEPLPADLAVVTGLAGPSAAAPWPSLRDALAVVDDDALRPWLLAPIYKRLQRGLGDFLTELRPACALFVRFDGIDYDADDAAGDKLDAYIRWIQTVVERAAGALIDLNIGDKGSYLYINFGAPLAHEDNAARAVHTALALRNSPPQLDFIHSVQIGISQGRMRAGAYGGSSHRTYGVLGNEVNMAARLMMAAAPGQILVSEHVFKATQDAFSFGPQLTLNIKGHAAPTPAFSLADELRRRPVRLQEPSYALPMVGRQAELQTIRDRLNDTLHGQPQVIGIVAEAGLGKSRLVAEAIRIARSSGFACFGGACQSDAISAPYQAWKAVWQAFFDTNPDAPPAAALRLLEREIQTRAPNRLQAMPLLGILLNLDIPENDFTQDLDPQYRQSALHSLLEDCLRAAAAHEPVLIVIEDVHWIDALSHDLLETLVKALIDSPVCFVLAYRPPQLARLAATRLESLPSFTEISLRELDAAEAKQAIRAKLTQLYPAHSEEIPPRLIATLAERSQGNPFYLEELLNYLRDQDLDPRAAHALDRIELPDSLRALVLSRIDRLGEREKTTLRAASIIGRMFRVAWLTGYYTDLDDPVAINAHLARLQKSDITLAIPEPEPTYLFKHIVTYEVTYQSLSYATRAWLHERLARFLESQVAAGKIRESAVLDVLVHHYTHTANREKQRQYLQRASNAALLVSAFDAARDYLIRLLDLTPVSDPSRSALERQVGDVHARLGDYDAAQASLEQALAAAPTDADRAATRALLAEITFQKGDYGSAQKILLDAVPLARASRDMRILCRALSTQGRVNWRLGDTDGVVAAFEESLILARAVGDVPRELAALNGLGVAYLHTDGERAEQLLTEVLQRAHAVGNRERVMIALANLGVLEDERTNDATARTYHQKALTIARELGTQYHIAHCLSNLARCEMALDDIRNAKAHNREALALAHRIGTRYVTLQALCSTVEIAYAEGDREWALTLLGLMRRQSAWSNEDTHWFNALLVAWALDPQEAETAMAKGDSLDWETTIQALLER